MLRVIGMRCLDVEHVVDDMNLCFEDFQFVDIMTHSFDGVQSVVDKVFQFYFQVNLGKFDVVDIDLDGDFKNLDVVSLLDFVTLDKSDLGNRFLSPWIWTDVIYDILWGFNHFILTSFKTSL